MMDRDMFVLLGKSSLVLVDLLDVDLLNESKRLLVSLMIPS
jgi:hypothetical protein